MWYTTNGGSSVLPSTPLPHARWATRSPVSPPPIHGADDVVASFQVRLHGSGCDTLHIRYSSTAEGVYRAELLLVEGADGREVRLYDAVGRILATRRYKRQGVRFPLPASGVYKVKVGEAPARRVVVAVESHLYLLGIILDFCYICSSFLLECKKK